MKDSIISLLCKPDFWKSVIYSISAGGVVVSFFTDPKLQGLILAAGVVLGRPFSLLIAKIILNLTANYAVTPSKKDDVAHAAAQGILEAYQKKQNETV